MPEDFTDDQKQYLQGFAAGSGIGLSLAQLPTWAATLGLNRTFWGYTTGSVTSYLNQAPPGTPVFLHDTLQKSPPASVAEIARAGNLAKVGELGMSFGGAIAGELCMYDTRCAVGVNMDGGNFPFSATNADEPVPFLMFHSDPAYLYREMERPVPATGPRSFNEFSYERIATAGSLSLPWMSTVGFESSNWLSVTMPGWSSTTRMASVCSGHRAAAASPISICRITRACC